MQGVGLEPEAFTRPESLSYVSSAHQRVNVGQTVFQVVTITGRVSKALNNLSGNFIHPHREEGSMIDILRLYILKGFGTSRCHLKILF